MHKGAHAGSLCEGCSYCSRIVHNRSTQLGSTCKSSSPQDTMAMRPDSMERWGVVGILTEAARLLHQHLRLFLPFFLAFQIPATFLSIFQGVFLVLPHPITMFVAGYTAFQGEDVNTDNQPSLILSYTLNLLVLTFSTLVLAAFAYIVEYIYNSADTESDDGSIIKKVFTLLPCAVLRIFVTYLWTYLVLFLLSIACVIVAFILNAILIAIIGGPSGPTPAFFLFIAVPCVIVILAVTIMFAFAQPIAVLEPEKYGRAALKQSTKYARGRAGTIFCILTLSVASGLSITYAPAQAVASAGIPLWVKIILASLLSILSSVVSAYVELVGVVMYFVSKSSFEAVLPEFQRGSNISVAENPYEPLVYGSAQPKTIGEP